jgi:transcriptional regulator with XRE-family HTH domain
MPKPIHRGEYDAVRALLRQLRVEAGLKQSELSDALGKPQPYISAIETGHRRVDLIEIRDICGVLGIGLAEFVAALEKSILMPGKRKQVTRRRVG